MVDVNSDEFALDIGYIIAPAITLSLYVTEVEKEWSNLMNLPSSFQHSYDELSRSSVEANF